MDGRFIALAREFGAALGRERHTLIFGGTDTGMMGAMARSAREAQGRVVGVMPRFMLDEGVPVFPADESLVVEDMGERKWAMLGASDVVAVLPGGLGTLDELFEVLALRVLKRVPHRVVVVNAWGFFDPLAAMIERIRAERMAREETRGYCAWVTDVRSGMAELASP